MRLGNRFEVSRGHFGRNLEQIWNQFEAKFAKKLREVKLYETAESFAPVERNQGSGPPGGRLERYFSVLWAKSAARTAQREPKTDRGAARSMGAVMNMSKSLFSRGNLASRGKITRSDGSARKRALLAVYIG